MYRLPYGGYRIRHIVGVPDSRQTLVSPFLNGYILKTKRNHGIGTVYSLAVLGFGIKPNVTEHPFRQVRRYAQIKVTVLGFGVKQNVTEYLA